MKCIFKWFDLWVGIYIDTVTETLYFFYLPCCGIKFNITPAINWFWQKFGTIDDTYPYYTGISKEYHMTVFRRKYYRIITTFTES